MDAVFFISQVLSLSLPILISGILLIACMKKRWFEFLKKPIDGGRNIFGQNKTWRGVLIYPVVATPVTALMHFTAGSSSWLHPVYSQNPWVLGITVSAAYVFGELVNSFVKRRLKIRPGESNGRIQAFFDNMDGAIAAGILLFFGYQVSLEVLAASFFISLALHATTDAVMRKIGLKSKQH